MTKVAALGVFIILFLLVILTQTSLPTMLKQNPLNTIITPTNSPNFSPTPTSKHSPNNSPTPRSRASISYTPTNPVSPNYSITPQPAILTPIPTPQSSGTNQLINPCFDGVHNDDPPSWQQTSGWDVSMFKNPCGPKQTAARINDPEQAGESGPDRDERIWQVVPSYGRYLVAEMRCVHHFAYYTDMNIYGGSSSNGPWTLVWTPFTLANCSKDRWGEALSHSQTQIGQNYSYYKSSSPQNTQLPGLTKPAVESNSPTPSSVANSKLSPITAVVTIK